MEAIDIDALEEMIRKGEGKKVKEYLLTFKPQPVHRSILPQLAKMSRRLGMPDLGIKWLYPLIRDHREKVTEASSEEALEYAATLTRIGLSSESLLVLNEIQQENPSLYLYKSFCHFSQWEYEESVPLLRRYLGLTEENSYPYLLGLINLAASLTYVESFEEAIETLQMLTSQLDPENHVVLIGNCYELYGQVFLLKREYKKAKEYFELAQNTIRSSGSRSSFFVEKWSQIIHLIEKKQGYQKAFHEFVARCLSENQYETVRQCHFYEAVFMKNESLLDFNYYGTPFSSYRKKIENWTDRDFHHGYVWHLNQSPYEPYKSDKQLDIEQLSQHFPQIKEDRLLGNLLQCLARDFYTPPKLTTVFSVLYPDEYFDYTSSFMRVHKVISRLRKVLESSPYDLSISVENKAAQLFSTSKISLKLPQEIRIFDSKGSHYEKLKDHFKDGKFTMKEAMNILTLNERNCQRVIKSLVEEDSINKFGKGKSSHYKIAS